MKQRFLLWLIPRLIVFIYKFLRLTIRWELVGDYDHWRKNPHLLAFWHARMLMMPYISKEWNGFILSSEHRDGSYTTAVMGMLGIGVIRGSSSRGGARAFLKMLRAARDGHSLGITPDGPRGPREVMQEGTVQLAKRSVLPLRVACYATKRHWRINSWDRLYIPKPFTRGVFILSDEVYADSDDDQVNMQRFQAVMDETQRRADSYFEAS